MIQKTRNKIKITILLITLPLLVYCLYVNTRVDCGPNASRNFREDFTYMTSQAEYCGANRDNCEIRLPHWEKPIVVQVNSASIEKEKIIQIQNLTYRALENISEVTPIKILRDPKLEPNLFVFVMNEKMVTRLNEPDARNIGLYKGLFHQKMYDIKGCSAHMFLEKLEDIASDEFQEVFAAIIFVHHSREGFDLEYCIYEELAAVVGLENDPEGYPSLFSKGDYEIVDEKIRYSKRILLMFQAIYEIVEGKFTDIDAYCQAREH